MDSAPTWADQWDYQNPDPLPSQENNSNDKRSKSKNGKFIKWVKQLCKKSDNK